MRWNLNLLYSLCEFASITCSTCKKIRIRKVIFCFLFFQLFLTSLVASHWSSFRLWACFWATCWTRCTSSSSIACPSSSSWPTAWQLSSGECRSTISAFTAIAPAQQGVSLLKKHFATLVFSFLFICMFEVVADAKLDVLIIGNYKTKC